MTIFIIITIIITATNFIVTVFFINILVLLVL